MNINRDNYEDFFLLYVDNELSAAERNTVEEFVRQHPDLREELSALQQTIILPVIVPFDKKNALLKEESISALQEKLLLFADQELSEKDSKVITKLIESDVTVSQEWYILQQTKLQPDTDIIFPDKKLLFRTEKVIEGNFKWWRVAAAVLLLGAFTWTGVKVYKNNFNTAMNADVAQGFSIKSLSPVTTNNFIPENGDSTVLTSANVLLQEEVNADTEKNYSQNLYRANNTNVIEPNEAANNNLQQTALEDFNRKGRNEFVLQSVIPENKESNMLPENIIVKSNPNAQLSDPVSNEISTGGNSQYIIKTAITANNNAADENNVYLLENNEKTKRTKIGGFFRKVKRVLERTANVKTGEGLQIASFEIAAK